MLSVQFANVNDSAKDCPSFAANRAANSAAENSFDLALHEASRYSVVFGICGKIDQKAELFFKEEL
jgi:hypothetical protein